MRTIKRLLAFLPLFLSLAVFASVLVIPTEVQQPGTQPLQVGNLESPDRCDNCHGGYNQAVEPAYNWRGSMMANAGRDPLFWATLAVAEQDFPKAGDFCLRCHSMEGWIAGRSEPTDGSQLQPTDADGVSCDTCHKMTNTDNSEHLGAMTSPFVANDRGSQAKGYYGSGMLSLWGGSEKLGPYAATVARHPFLQSKFHRRAELCGSCHDVSNPVVGDLAPGNGKQPTGDPVAASGVLGTPVETKAAFNNFPYMYGVVERTSSEHAAGALSQTAVSTYSALPSELKAGAIRDAYQAAQAAGQGGNYGDGTLRTFSCQSCHVSPTTGKGCNKSDAPNRTDLPLHDMTGGNTWAPDAILDQNARGTLRLGGGMTSLQQSATLAGKARALAQLQKAATMTVDGNKVRIVNLTGHKLPTGYPEGRRMWLNVKWFDILGRPLREDGKYGPLNVVLNSLPLTVETLLNLDDPNTKVYQAKLGMTPAWAGKLIGLGYAPGMTLGYDRVTGAPDLTLGQVASDPSGNVHETFHFALNDGQLSDNRIPPYRMSYDEARRRNALPVPATQYGTPGPGGHFDHFDVIDLKPPAFAATAELRLMYQTTSWEYIQFLVLANNRAIPFLANEGQNLLDTWLATGMSSPVTMATATWRLPRGRPTLNNNNVPAGPGGR